MIFQITHQTFFENYFYAIKTRTTYGTILLPTKIIYIGYQKSLLLSHYAY